MNVVISLQLAHCCTRNGSILAYTMPDGFDGSTQMFIWYNYKLISALAGKALFKCNILYREGLARCINPGVWSSVHVAR